MESKHAAPPGCQSVLLVEDEPLVREELRDLLEDEGYQVCEAANGQQALAALSAGLRPAVIVLDMLMPVMDGYTFLRELKERGVGVPVVLATAADDDVPPELPCIRKPYTADPLLHLLKQVAFSY